MVNIKGISKLLLVSICIISLISCNRNKANVANTDTFDEKILSSVTEEADINDSKEESSELTMNIQVGNKNFTAIMYDNNSAKAFVEKLPLTINMGDMNGNEMYYFMDDNIPASSKRPGKINNGDIMLYGSNCLVVFYKTFNTVYSYTSLGYIKEPEGFKDAIYEAGGEVTFSLNP